MVTKLPFSSVSAAIAIAAVNNSPPAIKKSVRRDLTILSFALDALFRLLVLVWEFRPLCRVCRRRQQLICHKRENPRKKLEILFSL